MIRLASALVLLAACDDEPAPLPTGDTGAPGDDDDTPTIPPVRNDEGSIVVVSNRPSVVDPAGGTLFTGMFVESRKGWLNLAECVGVAGAFCADRYPTNPGESVLVQDPDPTLRDELETRDVGEQVTLGQLTAELATDGDLDYYFQFFEQTQVPTEPMGLALAGEWGPYTGDADVTPPTPMLVLSHPTDRDVEFFDSEPIALRWQPGERGEVFLLVDTTLERRLWWLEDDGSFDLDLSDLGLADGERVLLDLGRWGRSTVDHDGNLVDLQVKSNQRLRGSWRTIGTRVPLGDVPDTCDDARTASPLRAGNYSGDNSGLANDLDPNNGTCTPFDKAGQDGILPLELLSGDVVEVTYTLASPGDAVAYLMTDCSAPQTCEAGADELERGQSETFEYVAPEDQRVYLVLDGFARYEAEFTLDLRITSVTEDVLTPFCSDAIAAGPIGPGTYQGRMGGNANLLEPDCAGGPADGGEGIAEVYLLPNEHLTAHVTTPGAQSTLYLLYNCALGDSCAAGGVGGTLEYDNTSGASEHLYLVVDGGPAVDAYVLELEIQ